MKKCAIYARVCTPEQHVETQLYDLRQLAAQRGLRGRRGVYRQRRIWNESPATGAGRPYVRRSKAQVLRRAHCSIRPGGRSDQASASATSTSLIPLGFEFVSRRENVDTSGPMGRLFLTLIGSIAELEADLIKRAYTCRNAASASLKACRSVANRWTLTTRHSSPTVCPACR